MLEFRCIFDAKTEIKDFILSRNKHVGDQAADIQLKIVGQEQDGTILYTWVEASIYTQDTDVTYFGSYEASTKVNKVIFIHDKLLKVANCTINQERTFLGFVTVEQAYRSEGYGKKQKQDIYKAYVAEIQPQNTVFYLNLERQYYLKLQFLYGQYKGHVKQRESHLLVFLHKESIGLYHLPIARVGNEGVIMSGEPKKDQVFHKKFIWSQFDKTHQRLYVVYFRKHGKNNAGQATHKPFLTAYQLDSNTVSQFTLEVLLDFPIPHFKSTSRSHYYDHGPSDVIPDSAVNLEVITHPNGTLCICHQQFLSNGSSKPRKSTSQDSDEGIGLHETDEAHVKYSVAMVHHGKTLHCQTVKLERNSFNKSRLFFSWIGDYLMVHLPEYFTHLLNVSIDYEACHHILWHGDVEHPKTKFPTPRGHFIREKTPASQTSGAAVFESGALKAYKVTVDTEALIDVFRCTASSTLRQAVMHHATVHTRDLAMTKRLFESLVNDICSPEVSPLLQEYLLGSSYCTLRPKVEKTILRFIPFTCAEVFRGQNHSSYDGERLSSISYHTLRGVSLGTYSGAKMGATERFTNNDELWDNLKRHLLGEQVQPSKRFAVKEVRKMMQDASWDFLVAPSPQSPTTEHQSLFGRLGSVARSAARSAFGGRTTPDVGPQPAGKQRPSSRTEIILGPSPSFLQANAGNLQCESEFSNKTAEFLAAHLKKYLRREAISVINNVAVEYTACQVQQTRLLCYIVWSVINKDGKHFPDANLNVAGRTEELELFRFYERCVLAAEELAIPLTNTFLTYFASLGLRCLKFRMFMQYVSRNTIIITLDFASRVLKELSDEYDGNVDIKLQVLQTLSQKDAIELLREWDHPKGRAMLAQMYSMVCLTEDMTSGWEQVQFQKRDLIDQNTDNRELAPDLIFPTLDTLVHHMESIDGGLAQGQSIAGAPFTSTFLRHASLENLLSWQPSNTDSL